MYDFIGLGALNIDYILTEKKIRSLNLNLIETYGSDFEPGIEEWVKNLQVTEDRIAKIGSNNFRISCGGSAFNTIYAMSSLKQNLKLGFIGIAGKPEDNCDFKEKFASAGIDDQFVLYDESQSCGKCISYISTDRSLQTSEPIARHFGGYLEKNRENILKYLSQTRFIHITSIFDEETPKIVNSIIKEAKMRNPLLKISVDPGYEYVKNLETYTKDLLSMADFVFLNRKEFDEFGRTKNDLTTARNIFNILNLDAHVIVLKTYSSIHIFEKFHDQIYHQRYLNYPTPRFLIQDDTGAGDVFAAGFLAAQILPVFRGDFTYGIKLGLNMVRQKLKGFGPSNYQKFPILVNKLLDELYKRKYLNLRDFIARNIVVLKNNLITFILGFFASILATFIIILFS